MKKLFAIVAMLGLFATAQVNAQDAVPAATSEETVAATSDSIPSDSVPAEEVAPATEEAAEEAPAEEAVVAEGGIMGVHKGLKTKFIEGGPEFMALVSIALVIGLAFCIERIIYLSLAKVNAKKLMGAIADALSNGDVEGAKNICRNTAGPVASICYQGLLRIDEGLDTVERSVVSYGSLQSSKLESGGLNRCYLLLKKLFLDFRKLVVSLLFVLFELTCVVISSASYEVRADNSTESAEITDKRNIVNNAVKDNSEALRHILIVCVLKLTSLLDVGIVACIDRLLGESLKTESCLVYIVNGGGNCEE